MVNIINLIRIYWKTQIGEIRQISNSGNFLIKKYIYNTYLLKCWQLYLSTISSLWYVTKYSKINGFLSKESESSWHQPFLFSLIDRELIHYNVFPTIQANLSAQVDSCAGFFFLKYFFTSVSPLFAFSYRFHCSEHKATNAFPLCEAIYYLNTNTRTHTLYS